MESTEALWVGDGIRVRADGVLEDLACHPDGSSTWVPYRSTVWASDAQAIAHAFAAVAKQMERFRQALPENERGPGWEQAVLTAIDTRREVLAAVDAHVPGWDPARPVAEVVGHLAEEALKVGELEEGLSMANDEIAGLDVEREALRSCVSRAVTLLGSVASGLQPFATLQSRALQIARETLRATDSMSVSDLIQFVGQFATAEQGEPVSPAYEFDPYVAMVTEFHRAMRLPVRIVPSVGSVEERVLRVRLLLEEVLEFATASAVRVELAGFRIKGTGELTIGENVGAAPDLVAMTHELGDCQVIVSGCAVQLGLPLMPAVAEEIHPANMRKEPSLDAAGKVKKPEGWKPANVARIVERALASGEVSP